jgi:hypothetical protein
MFGFLFLLSFLCTVSLISFYRSLVNFVSKPPIFHCSKPGLSMAPTRSVIKSGFLKIEIEGIYITQFVELANKALNYFDKKEKSTFFFIETGRAQNGSIPLDYHSHVANNTIAVNSGGHGFSIYRDGKAIKFMTDTLEEKTEWMDIIDEIINEEEKDSRLSGSDLLSSSHTPLASPNSEPLAPIDTPSTRKTYKSYMKDFLEMSDSRDGQWKEAWFILSMEALTYYSSIKTTHRIGFIIISESTEVHSSEAEDDLTGTEFIFRVKNKDHSIFLAATSEESRLKWMNAIHSVKKMNLCRSEGDLV